MKGRSDSPDWDRLREKIIGLGERSTRKSYYPELQQRLAELERFRALLDQSHDIILLVEVPSGQLVDVNESACRQLGYTRRELVECQIYSLLPPDVSEQMQEVFSLSEIRQEDRDTILTTLLKHDASEIPVEIKLRLSPFNGGTYAIFVARDISERKNRERQVSRLLSGQIVVNELALTLGETRDLDAIYHGIYSHVRRLMDAWAFVISSYDQETRLIRACYIVQEGSVLDVIDFPPIPVAEPGRGTQSRVIHSGRPFYTADYRRSRRTGKTEYTVAKDGSVQEGPPPEDQGEPVTNSALYAPMKVEGKIVGVMFVQSPRFDAYSQEDIDLLSGIANVSAVAIQNARLYESLEQHTIEVEQRVSELETLHHIAVNMSTNLKLDKLLQFIVAQAVRLVNAESSAILLLDEASGDLVFQTAVDGAAGLRVPSGKGIVWRAIRERAPQIVRNAEFDPDHYDVVGDATDLPTHSLLVTPLYVGDRPIGVITAVNKREGEFSDPDCSLLDTLAGHAATAIENARLHTEVQRYAGVLEQRVEERTAQLEAANRELNDFATELQLYQAHLEDLVHERTAEISRLAAVIEQAQETIMITDLDGNLVYVNPYFEVSSGYTSTEALGKNPNMLKSGQQDVEFYRELWQTLRSGGAWSGVFINRRKDGGLYHESATLFPIEDATGKVVNYAAVKRDISEQVQTQAALQQYTERLRTLHAIDGVILSAWSSDEIAKAALRHTRQLIPYQKASVWHFDVEQQTASLLAVYGENGDSIPADLLSEINLALDRIPRLDVLRHGQVFIEEDIWVPQSSNSDYLNAWFADARAYLVAPLLSHGVLIGALVLQSDRADAFARMHMDMAQEVGNQVALAMHQAQLRANLESEQQRLATLVEHLPEGILLLDHNYRILLANPVAQTYLPVLSTAKVGDALTHLANRPIETFLDSPVEDLAPDDADMVASYAASELSPDEATTGGTVLEISDPTHRVFEIIARPVSVGSDPTDRIRLDWLLVIRDITREREIAQQTQRRDRLAAVGQLAAGIAHDFNNIMAVVILYAQMALRDPVLSPALERRITTIVDQAYRATDMISQILDFSRRAVLERGAMDLVPFLKELVKLLERTVPENISLLLTYEPGQYVINGDPTRMQQAIMNIVLNARDAMPSGGVLRITLDRFSITPGQKKPVAEMSLGDWIKIILTDTGEGIAPDVLPHIFEPFFTTKAPGEGTGLGLAQAYGIVKQHDGEITVESQLGEGSTFTIYLPKMAMSEPEATLETQVHLPEGLGELVLLVEDSSATRGAISESLASLNYQVLEAENGKKALTILEKHSAEIAVIISDVVMPEMGGVALVHAVHKRSLDIPMILLTGHPMDEVLESLGAQGVHACLRKPISLEQLAALLAEVLDGA